MPGGGTLEQRLVDRIGREGPLPFSEFMEAALYDPDEGFFSRSGAKGAGRSGADFLTSPEVGPLFGVMVARATDAAWGRAGSPDPFAVIEAGAGRGRLAADVLAASPACGPALRYVLVERSSELRTRQSELLTIEPLDEALGPYVRAGGSGCDDVDDEVRSVGGVGPIVSALDELPALALDGVIVANELLDNLPFRVVERTGPGWAEVRVRTSERGFEEILVEASDRLGAEADAVAAGAGPPVGARLPVPTRARQWLARAAGVLRSGEMILVDYGAPAAELLERGQDGWLRCFRGQARVGDPLEVPGSRDLTCDLPTEYLWGAAQGAGWVVESEQDQASWLRSLGIDELVAQGAQAWRDGVARGDLAAIAGRSRVHEAEALLDPAGLGSHRVWTLRRRIA